MLVADSSAAARGSEAAVGKHRAAVCVHLGWPYNDEQRSSMPIPAMLPQPVIFSQLARGLHPAATAVARETAIEFAPLPCPAPHTPC